jgi:hypothetical protein
MTSQHFSVHFTMIASPLQPLSAEELTRFRLRRVLRNRDFLSLIVFKSGFVPSDQAFDLFLSGEISEKAAQELGVVVEGESAECPQDDCEGTLQPTDDCSMCDECYYSPCN